MKMNLPGDCLLCRGCSSKDKGVEDGRLASNVIVIVIGFIFIGIVIFIFVVIVSYYWY